jgi:hypothetical protein
MNRTYDELDHMLDDLNANREPAESGDLADLVEMARGLKELGRTNWPDGSFPLRTAVQLSQQLNPNAVPLSASPTASDLDATGELPPPFLPPRDLPAPTPLPRKRHSPVRRNLEVAAAVVVLVLFTALIATLLGNNGDTPQPTTSAAFGAAPAASTTAPAITGQSSTATTPATAPATPDTSLPASISDPALTALQTAAGFDLRAPTLLAPGLTMLPPAAPMRLGNFTSVTLKYRDVNGNDALTITEASPYQDSAKTMPADIFNSAVPQNLGNGVTASVYQSETNFQIWWEVGPTSIRLESGGPAGTTLLSKDLMLDIARSMVPVDHTTGATPSATGVTKDAAIAKARTLLGSLGGNTNAAPAIVQMTPLSVETAFGMPQPYAMDPRTPVWSINFPSGMSPAGCPDLGASVCNGGAITVIVDTQSGKAIAWRNQSGTWKQPQG